MKGGNLGEELGDEHEDVQVKGDGGGDGVDFAPSPFEVFYITGWDGNCQDDKRNDAENDPWGHLVKRKEKAGDAGQCGGSEENRSPAVEALAGNHAEDGDESGEDSDQTQQDVKQSESRWTRGHECPPSY